MTALKDWALSCIQEKILFYPDKVSQGLKEDSLFELLNPYFEEAKQKYKTHPDFEVPSHNAEEIFDLAINDAVLHAHSFVNSPLW